jgi:apolipoprotein N-acyltransferase
VWPEAPAPFAEDDPQFRSGMASLARTAHSPIIVDNLGTSPNPDTPNGYDRFNSASFIIPDGSFAGRYDKMHLVPFGEYVPFKRILFFAGNLLAEAGDLSPGTHRTVFTYDGHHYGTFICYESTFADEVRLFVLDGADALVNISDDGWYGDTSAPWQHLNMVRMRAIENHRWVLRATNTGITAAINPYGQVTAAAPRHIRTSLQVGFGYEHDITFYTAHGDLFAYVCSLITLLALAFSLICTKLKILC